MRYLNHCFSFVSIIKLLYDLLEILGNLELSKHSKKRISLVENILLKNRLTREFSWLLTKKALRKTFL